jgi:hypothetical protein
MLMRKLVYVVLLIILGGCIPPSPSLEDIHQRVAKQVEVLIDRPTPSTIPTIRRRK